MQNKSLNKAIATLSSLCEINQNASVEELFKADPTRFQNFSHNLDDLLVDWSKCKVDGAIMNALFERARVGNVEQLRDQMFAGDPINITEGRAVMHVALRAMENETYRVDGDNIVPQVHSVLNAMTKFADQVMTGDICGHSKKPFRDVVNIGIGGSDLGPAMACKALMPYGKGLRLHFVSNVDGAHIRDTLKHLDPETTLFIIASKTFTTIETMTNAATARRWIGENLGDGAVGDHFVAVSTALDKVKEFGIPSQRVFGFWDWVGGRYSIWSAIGLPLMLAIGPDDFKRFLSGANAMDKHFKSAKLAENLPVILGVLGYWHRAICQYSTRAVIPYDERLARLPAYLQQLDMESNGKSVTREGGALNGPSGPIVWGEPGTNGQHAFFQLLHQGSDIIPVEFIVAAQNHEEDLPHHHELLLANCLAQSQALMKGRTLHEAAEQLRAKGMTEEQVAKIAPHRVFSGNRPSISIIHRKLDPFALGRLIALYEHRVFVEAALYNINAFDQWGVELGKELATQLLPSVTGTASSDELDASTLGLLACLQELQKNDTES